MEIRLATVNIERDSIVNGEGIRAVIWTQGCPHNCLGCHNPETHSLNGGYLVDVDDVIKKIDLLEAQDGITFSGGEPMLQPLACSVIAKHCKKLGFNVWCYTGYTYENLLKMSSQKSDILNFLKQIDVLIDGKFVIEEKSYDSVFRGSKNQRIIDVQESLLRGTTVVMTKFDDCFDNKKGRKNRYMFV